MAEREITVEYNRKDRQVAFAVHQLEDKCAAFDIAVSEVDIRTGTPETDILVLVGEVEIRYFCSKHKVAIDVRALRREGYQVIKNNTADATFYIEAPKVIICARTETGGMYGVLNIADRIQDGGGVETIKERVQNPQFSFRAVKFNLPWSPYRDCPATAEHLNTCRDLKFWERFIDMLAVNRFNALTLWSVHLFPWLVRTRHFPGACPLSDEELGHWREFWTDLFAYAKSRGVATYLVNWNIAVSPACAATYGVEERNDTSETVREYMRECVTQTIDTYPDLTGLGTSACDWMEGMSAAEKQDWIYDTFIAGMKAAGRPVRFIHRSTPGGPGGELRKLVDRADLPERTMVEVEFNRSHGHSTPDLVLTHDADTGAVDETLFHPEPTNYSIAWMVRNEDFFVLRWGEPAFVREHINANDHSYVDGYFVGSEGLIPAADYIHLPDHPHRTWEYLFEKNWLFYAVWGRLLYDPELPDEVFAGEFERRYGTGVGGRLLAAYALAGKVPRRIAAFHAGTRDFTLYAEGFLTPVKRKTTKGRTAFISIDELIDYPVLDPACLTIPAFVALKTDHKDIPADRITPLHLAEELGHDCSAILETVRRLRQATGGRGPAFVCELDDLEAWSYLGLYFMYKLRAATCLEFYKQTGVTEYKMQCIALLEFAADQWGHLVAVTEKHYKDHIPYANGQHFSWKSYKDRVQEDIVIADGM